MSSCFPKGGHSATLIVLHLIWTNITSNSYVLFNIFNLYLKSNYLMLISYFIQLPVMEYDLSNVHASLMLVILFYVIFYCCLSVETDIK